VLLLSRLLSQVIAGLGMLYNTSYALLTSVANVSTLQFDFISMTPNGLLFYANISSAVTVKPFYPFCAFIHSLFYFQDISENNLLYFVLYITFFISFSPFCCA